MRGLSSVSFECFERHLEFFDGAFDIHVSTVREESINDTEL